MRQTIKCIYELVENCPDYDDTDHCYRYLPDEISEIYYSTIGKSVDKMYENAIYDIKLQFYIINLATEKWRKIAY